MTKALKLTLVLSILAGAALFFACGGGSTAPEAPAAPPKPAPKAPEEPKADNPWLGAAVGDWVEYKMTGGMGQKWSVVEKTADKVVYEMVTLMGGKEINRMKQEVSLTAPPAAPGADPQNPGATPVMGEGDLTVGGQTLHCMTIEVTVSGKVSKSWTCKDVPLTGMVRSEMDGKPVMELVAFGRGQ